MHDESREQPFDLSFNKETPKFTRKSRKKLFVTIGTVLTVLLLSYFANIGYSLFISDKISNGVFVDEIDAGGMLKSDLFNLLSKKYSGNLSEKIINLQARNQSESFTYQEAKIAYDIEKACQEAFNFGRTGNLLTRFLNLTRSKTSKVSIELSHSFDKNFIESRVNALFNKTSVPVKEPGIALKESDKLYLQTGHNGQRFDKAKAIQQIQSFIQEFKDGQIELEMITLPKKNMDLNALYAEITIAPKDASATVVNNKLKIVPEVYGRKIDKKVLADIISRTNSLSDQEELLPVTFTPATIVEATVKERVFRDQLASFSTQFYTGDTNNNNRKVNITIAASKINETLLAPNQTFSFNNVVGPRTPENGYKDAHAYVAGKIVDSTGGGICQVSSTLYNAVLLSDLPVSERHNHTFTVGYVPKGRDAAVSYGAYDLKFKNPTKYPIKINCWVTSENKIHFSLTGTNEAPSKTVEYRSEIVSETAPTLEKTVDATLYEGETKVINEGMKGYVVNTFKIVKENGAVVSEAKLHTSKYSAHPRQIKVGKKKKSPAGKEPASGAIQPTPEVKKGVDDSYNPPVGGGNEEINEGA